MFVNYDSYSLTLIVTLVSLFGLTSSYIMYTKQFHCGIFPKFLLNNNSLTNLLELFLACYYTFSAKWFFDKFYNLLVVKVVNLMHFFYMFLDKGIFEMVGPFGVSTLSSKQSFSFISENKGYIMQYLLLIYYGFFLSITFFFITLMF